VVIGEVFMGQQAEDDDFEQFVIARSRALLRYGYVLTGDAHDAADLVQESLIRLRDGWSTVRNPEPFVRTTMSRLHISWWRRHRREHLTEVVPDSGRLDPGLRRIDDDTGLWHALGTLPRRQRAVLVLRYYERLGDDEIAETLGIARGTVRSQALRGLRALRRRIAEPPPGWALTPTAHAFNDPRRGSA
jgi:RNA polymerase sigma-70 factor (sigma-E family)